MVKVKSMYSFVHVPTSSVHLPCFLKFVQIKTEYKNVETCLEFGRLRTRHTILKVTATHLQTLGRNDESLFIWKLANFLKPDSNPHNSHYIILPP